MSFKNLQVGISGLRSQQKKIEVIGNNLANLTTAGFKKSRVTFEEMFYDLQKSASGGSGNLGGTNPHTIGTGVGIGSIDKVFTQGARQVTARSLDFYIDGKDFFVAQNGSTGELMLTRNGAFQLDGDLNLVDNSGNKVIGFNVDKETGAVADTASTVQLDAGPIQPNATSNLALTQNIDSSIPESSVDGNSFAWELFSGGENFGGMTAATIAAGGSRDTYGSGYYQESVQHQDTAMNLSADGHFVALDGATISDQATVDVAGTVTLQAGEGANFAVGDAITISQMNASGVLVQQTNLIGAIAGDVLTLAMDPNTSAFTNATTTATVSMGAQSGQSGGTLAATLDSVDMGAVPTVVAGDVVRLVQYDAANTVILEETVDVASIAGNVINFGSALQGSYATTAGSVTVERVNDEPFSAGEDINLRQGVIGVGPQAHRTIASVRGGVVALTGSVTVAPGGTVTPTQSTGFISGATSLTGTNLTDGTIKIGNSASAQENDILRSQITMVNAFGNIIASFYRVGSEPAEYSRATVTDVVGNETTAGVGEFSNWMELKELLERALRDDELENNVTAAGLNGSADLRVSVDKFGKISFDGSGVVDEFRLVVNGDNTEVLGRFGDMAITDNSAEAVTQARFNANGHVVGSSSTLLINAGYAARSTNTSLNWFDPSTGLENYGYTTAAPSTEYGEFAGLRLDGNLGQGFGKLTLSLTNGLGQAVTSDYSLYPRDADPSLKQFSTMGELVSLIQDDLRSAEFSSIADGGVLVNDQTATVSLHNGRLHIATSHGSFNNLSITPQNQVADAELGVLRTDQQNFGTVLGELMHGFSGKSGSSNRFVKADATSQTTIFDSKGNSHTSKVYFVKDRSAGLTNIEWKFKAGLNPNLNSFASSDSSSLAYRDTYNTMQDEVGTRGVIGFDITTGDVLSDTGNDSMGRYRQTGLLSFTATQNASQAADASAVTMDFRNLTSFNGSNTVIAKNLDGFAMGNLVRITTEENSGNINGVYSNGKIRTLAKIGLMAIPNPGGLMKTGSSYYAQTGNSTSGGAKGIDQVYYVNAEPPAGIDSVTSTVSGGALEASNVDLTEELTEMIVTQRSFSASGKSITSADEMLQETLSLKR